MVLINEFRPNPSGTDPSTSTFELLGTPGTTFSGWILSIEGDNNSGAIDRAAEVSGTFDANGILTVAVPDLENPSFTVVLTSEFNGSIGDSLVDDAATQFGTVHDAIGVPDTAGDQSNLYGEALGGTDFAYTGDEPRLIFRDSVTGGLFALNDPDGGMIWDTLGNSYFPGDFNTDPTADTDTFGEENPTMAGESVTPLINEFQPNPSGTDPSNTTVELTGGPGEEFSGWIVSIEGDNDSGLVDRAAEVSGTFDANGLLAVSVPDLENPTFTVILASAFNGVIGDSILDSLGDPTALFGTVFDAIGVPDNSGDEANLYGVVLGGTDFSYTGDEPRLIFRDGDSNALYAVNDPDNGEIYDTTGTVYSPADFDIDPTAGTDTFGVVNPIRNGGTTPPGPVAALVSEIQGAGAASAMIGQTVTIEAIVVGDFQGGGLGADGDLSGFFVQEEDTQSDGNASTSEGIFIFDGFSPTTDVNAGDLVQVTGTVTEFQGETQIDLSSVTIVGSDNLGLVTPATVSMPTLSTTTNSAGNLIADLEAYEGMLVTFDQNLTVTEMFNLDRFGEIRVSSGGRLTQFTQTDDPDIAGFQAHLEDIATRTITIDDGQTNQNPDPISLPDGSLGTEDQFRMGDTVTELTGVVSFARATDEFGTSNSNQTNFRIHPTIDPVIENTNPRPAEPKDVGSDFTVASLNVLNYFTTIDNGETTELGHGPRGADSVEEFDRQTEKLVNAILEIDADVFGLVELENDFVSDQGTTAIENLVNELNFALGADVYEFVFPGSEFVGTDAIATSLIYNSTSVALADGTNVAILDDAALAAIGYDISTPIFDGPSTNRAAIAATFEALESGEMFTATVNHFKSKGSPGSFGDADIGDGQGNANITRLEGAMALDAWLDTDPTGSGDSDFLILGDLNAYQNEDPIVFLESKGFTDLAHAFHGDDGYSFVFDGQTGTLDYAMASSSLLDQVTGVTEWHINADEPDAIDYNLDFGRNAGIFDGSVPARVSDHDPIIIGLNLSSVAEHILVSGTVNRETLVGSDANELFQGGGKSDVIITGGGSDIVDLFETFNNGQREITTITDFDTSLDALAGISPDDISNSRTLGINTYVGLADGDWLRLIGVDDFSQVQFSEDLLI